MPPNRTDRASRNGEIPGNFILNWRSSGPGVRHGTKQRPLVRRPPTACEACRSAKVKCSGKKDCERCVGKGITCKYTTRANDDQDKQCNLDSSSRPDLTPLSPSNALTPWPPLLQPPANVTAGEMPADHLPLQEHTVFEPGIALQSNSSADWTSGNSNPGMGTFDCNWDAIDTGLHEQSFQPVPSDLDLLQSLDNTGPRNLAQGTYVHSILTDEDSQNTNSTSISPSCGPPASDQTDSPAACLHRASLMLFLSKIATVKQQKRLDQVFKVTGEVVKACQDMIDCATCEVACTDLLLMMTVLQETHPCFHCIAKSDLDSDVKVSFGGYEVSFNDTSLRSMLVMDLVRRAGTVLTWISTTGQTMMDNLPEPCRQAHANIVYLEETISYFRTILQCVKRCISEAV